MAKFTKAELSNLKVRNEKIVALYKKGMSGNAIAKDAGLSGQMVYVVLKHAGASKSASTKKAPAKKIAAPVKVAKKSAAAKVPAKPIKAKKVPVVEVAVKKSRGRPKKK